MPLDKSGSKDAFSRNVSAEMHAGKPQKQALAIAYSIARKARKKADGGAANIDWDQTTGMADGGAAFDDRFGNWENSFQDRWLSPRDAHDVAAQRIRSRYRPGDLTVRSERGSGYDKFVRDATGHAPFRIPTSWKDFPRDAMMGLAMIPARGGIGAEPPEPPPPRSFTMQDVVRGPNGKLMSLNPFRPSTHGFSKRALLRRMQMPEEPPMEEANMFTLPESGHMPGMAEGGSAEETAYQRAIRMAKDYAPFPIPESWSTLPRDAILGLNMIPGRGAIEGMKGRVPVDRAMMSRQMMQGQPGRVTEVEAANPGFRTFMGQKTWASNDPSFKEMGLRKNPPSLSEQDIAEIYRMGRPAQPKPTIEADMLRYYKNPWTVPGSRVPEMASGGGTGIPYYQASAIRGMIKQQGLLNSPVPGRTDKLPIRVPTGAYVVPADVVSSLGEGNTHAGGTVLDGLFSPTAPAPGVSGFKAPRMKRAYSTRMTSKKKFFQEGGDVLSDPVGIDQNKPMDWGMDDEVERRNSMMRPSSPYAQALQGMLEANPKTAMPPHEMPASAGPGFPGPMQSPEAPQEEEDDGEHVPIIAAGGEYIISPESLMARYGDLDRAHKVLDAFVKQARADHIKTLKKLPGPSK